MQADPQVINIPPDIAPDTVGSDTILNVHDGGELRRRGTIAEDGAIVNVDGGLTNTLTLRSGAIANVNGGGVHEWIVAYEGGSIFHSGGRSERVAAESGGAAEVRGGAIGQLAARSTSSLTILGIDFAINGAPVAGLQSPGDALRVDFQEGDILTAILADGTAFGHRQVDGSFITNIQDGALTLKLAAGIPAVDPGVTVIGSASNVTSAGQGQTFRVENGGQIGEQFRAGPGSIIEIDGGTVGSVFHAVSAEVSVGSGSIGGQFQAFDETVVTVTGGTLGSDSQFHRGSTLNFIGGEGGARIDINDGAVMNLFGGSVFGSVAHAGGLIEVTGGQINRVDARGGVVRLLGGNVDFAIDSTDEGLVEFSGGRQGDVISVRAGGRMAVNAGAVRVNGLPVADFTQAGDSFFMQLGEGDTLSGVYPDGTPFVLSGDESQEIYSGITVNWAAAPAVTPRVIRVPTDPIPNGIRSGQTLILEAGGELPPNYTAGEGATLLMQGGQVGNNFEVIGAAISATGGVLNRTDVFHGSVVNISGTTEWSGIDVFAGGVLNISGDATTGGYVTAIDGSTVNISGGVIGGTVNLDGANVNVSGGVLGGLTLGSSSVGVITAGDIDDELVVWSGSELIYQGGAAKTVRGVGHASIEGGVIRRLVPLEGGSFELKSGVIDEFDNLGATTRVTGGALGDSNEWNSGTVEIVGYQFQVDGAPIAGLDQERDSLVFNYTPGTALSGVLADGSPFFLGPPDFGDDSNNINIENGVLRLTRTAEPTLSQALTVDSDDAPYGATPGREVTVVEGGALRSNFVVGPGASLAVQGGAVGKNLEADRGEVTVTGGEVGGYADAFSGSVFTIAGGFVGEHFEAHDGSLLVVEGGNLGDSAHALSGSIVEVTGGVVGDAFEAYGGSEVNVRGGVVGENFRIFENAAVNITGGAIGSRSFAASGSTVNISGGAIGGSFDAREGSTVTMTGGAIGGSFDAEEGSTVTISGGALGRGINIRTGSNVEFTGGEFMLNGIPTSQPTVTLANGDTLTGTFADGSPFHMTWDDTDRLNGVTLTQSELPELDTTPMIVDDSTLQTPAGLRLGQTLTLRDGGALRDHFTAINSELNIEGGTVGLWVEAVGATVNISGGAVGPAFTAVAGSVVTIEGGEVGDSFAALEGSTVSITGGSVGAGARFGGQLTVSGGVIGDHATIGDAVVSGGVIGDDASFNGAMINDGQIGGNARFSRTVISGGTVGDDAFFLFDVTLDGGSIGSGARLDVRGTVDISSGAIGDSFTASGTVNVSGGTIGAGFRATNRAEVNLYGTQFALDGAPLAIELGSPLQITERGALLTGVLADGVAFDFDLSPESSSGDDYFSPSATLTLILVSNLDGDYSNDGVVDAADYTVWRDSVGSPAGSLLNDSAGGAIGDAQYDAWRTNYGAKYDLAANATAPETAACWLLLAAAAGLALRRSGAV